MMELAGFFYSLISIITILCKVIAIIALSIFPAWTLIEQISPEKLALDSLARLLLSIIINFIFIYLLEMLSYIIAIPAYLTYGLYLTLFAISLLYTISNRKRGIILSIFPWDGVAIWAALSIFIVGIQSLIVVYGVITWYGDWAEHYERALFFAQQLPLETKFINIWTLPARGPLYNTVAALMMSILGEEFWVYQLIATVLNSFPILAMALLIRDLARVIQYKALLWAFFIFAIAPFAIQHETFTWTKFFTLAFILAAIYFYRIAFVKEQATLVIISFIIFASAILAHYLSAVLVIFFVIHFFYLVYQKIWSWQTMGVITLCCALLLLTWFGYLFMTFGIKTTLTANSTVGGNYLQSVNNRRESRGEKTLSRSEIFLGNTISSIIPFGWRHNFTGLGSASLINKARLGDTAPEPLPTDIQYLCDLVNKPSSISGALGWSGMLGFLLAIFFWVKQRYSSENKSSLNSNEAPIHRDLGYLFWLLLFIVGIPLSIFVNPSYENSGITHINLQPFICLILIFVIAQINSMRYLQLICCGLFFIESVLGCWALLKLETRPVAITMQEYTNTLSFPASFDTEQAYVNNYIYKVVHQFSFLSDILTGANKLMLIITIIAAIGLALLAVKLVPTNPAKDQVNS